MTASWSGSPITWVSGNLSAATMNTEIRDRMDWLKAALALHGITSTSSLGPLKSGLYGVRATRTTTQSIPNSAGTEVTWPTEAFDGQSFHSTSVETGRITIPAGGGGYYHVGALATFAANSTGNRSLYLWHNDSLTDDAISVDAPSASDPASLSLPTFVQLAAGDFLHVTVQQTSGGALNVLRGAFWAYRVFAT
jgi:hypothetical protein